MIDNLLQLNRNVSERFGRLFTGRVDGCTAFASLVEGHLDEGMTVVDVGGGRAPLLPLALKQRFSLKIIGIDISREEIAEAPSGIYDEVIVGDVASLRHHAPVADLVFSRAVAEHVSDTPAMFSNLHGLLRDGGRSLHFMPNRYALFALANRALTNELSRQVLFTLQPSQRDKGGFKSYYERTYPSAMEELHRGIGFREIETTCYYSADYLSFFFPAHLGYVLYQNLNRGSGLRNLCESFTISARK